MQRIRDVGARGRRHLIGRGLERVKGIEPSYEAWEAAVLPLNYTRDRREFYCGFWPRAVG